MTADRAPWTLVTIKYKHRRRRVVTVRDACLAAMQHMSPRAETQKARRARGRFARSQRPHRRSIEVATRYMEVLWRLRAQTSHSCGSKSIHVRPLYLTVVGSSHSRLKGRPKVSERL